MGGIVASSALKPGKPVRIDGISPSIDSHFLDHGLPVFTQNILLCRCGEKKVASRYFHQSVSSSAEDRTRTGAKYATGYRENGCRSVGPAGRKKSMLWSFAAMGDEPVFAIGTVSTQAWG